MRREVEVVAMPWSERTMMFTMSVRLRAVRPVKREDSMASTEEIVLRISVLLGPYLWPSASTLGTYMAMNWGRAVEGVREGGVGESCSEGRSRKERTRETLRERSSVPLNLSTVWGSGAMPASLPGHMWTALRTPWASQVDQRGSAPVEVHHLACMLRAGSV